MREKPNENIEQFYRCRADFPPDYLLTLYHERKNRDRTVRFVVDSDSMNILFSTLDHEGIKAYHVGFRDFNWGGSVEIYDDKIQLYPYSAIYESPPLTQLPLIIRAIGKFFHDSGVQLPVKVVG